MKSRAYSQLRRARALRIDPARLTPSTTLATNAPPMVKDIDERLARLLTHPERFAELVGRHLVGPHDNLRERREDRRCNWVKVARVLGRRLDRRTLRCGAPRGDRRDSIEAPTVAEIAAEAGISVSTVKRINAEFRAADLIESFRVSMAYGDGNHYCGLPSIRRFTPKFLRLLGFSDRKVARNQLAAGRAWAARMGRAISPAAVRRARRARNLIGHTYQATPAAPPIVLEADADLRLERLRLAEEHPDWGLERCAAEARRLLRPN